MLSKIIDSGIAIGEELQELLLEEDNREIIENKRKQFDSISDDLAKEISDALISKNEKIVEFLKAEAINCDTHAKNCKTVGDLIIKNTVMIILRSFGDYVTSLNARFHSSSYLYEIDLKKCKFYLNFIEEAVYELYGVNMEIQLYKYLSNEFKLKFLWY